jgi:hypothetical protein
VHRLAADHPEADTAIELEEVQPTVAQPCPDTPGPEEPVQVPERVAPSIPLLKALRELREARARSVQPARDMLEAVIERAEQEVGAQEDQVSVQIIERILRDLDRLDEQFLQEMHERVPAITGVLMHLREQGTADFVTASQLDPILIDVEALYDSAKTIHASTIMMFLQGLKSFLTATAYRKIDSLPQRLQAFEERLMALIPMAQQWVSLGRLERTSIENILPV